MVLNSFFVNEWEKARSGPIEISTTRKKPTGHTAFLARRGGKWVTVPAKGVAGKKPEYIEPAKDRYGRQLSVGSEVMLEADGKFYRFRVERVLPFNRVKLADGPLVPSGRVYLKEPWATKYARQTGKLVYNDQDMDKAKEDVPDLEANANDEVKAVAQYEYHKRKTNDPGTAAVLDHIQEEELQHKEELEEAIANNKKHGETLQVEKGKPYTQQMRKPGKGAGKIVPKKADTYESLQDKVSAAEDKYGEDSPQFEAAYQKFEAFIKRSYKPGRD